MILNGLKKRCSDKRVRNDERYSSRIRAVTSNQVKSALGTVKDKVQSVLPDRDNPELDKTGIDRIMEWWNSK